MSEEQDDCSSGRNQLPTSGHSDEWGGFDDSEMNPPSLPQREFPQDDIGMLRYYSCRT